MSAPTTRKPARLSSTQVLILQALAKLPEGAAGLSVTEIEAKAKVAPSTGSLGPVNSDECGNHPDSLHARKLVKPRLSDDEENRSIQWKITDKGRKVAGQVKTRRRLNRADKIDASVLDPIINRFRTTRTYGLEDYTTADLTELRESLGEDYAAINLESLRLQIIARRKQGAYADESQKIRIAVQRAIRDFGPDGQYGQILSQAQVKALVALAPGE